MGVMLDDLGIYVATNAVFSPSLVLGTNLFLSVLPEQPANVVALYENSGPGPVFTMGSNHLPRIDRPELQFIVRNESYSTGRALSEVLYRLLTQITNQTIGGVLYQRIEAISNPGLIQRDETRRSVFSCNFYVMKGLST
jgi:hypothetical protein